MRADRARVARRVVAALLCVSAALSGTSARAHAQALDEDEPAKVVSKPGSSWLGAGLAFGVLNLPKLGVGIEIVGEARPRRFWPLAFGLTYWFDNESELAVSQLDLGVDPLFPLAFPSTGSRIIARAYQASAATCPYETPLGSGALSLCAGIEGGLLHVSSAGFVNAEAQTRPMFAFDAYVRWHFRFGSSGMGLTYSLGLFVPVLRDSFGYRNRSGVFHEEFQQPPVGGRLDLALSYGF